jgi:regulator of PEP synthase PpsR (kinase-PPPase family)
MSPFRKPVIFVVSDGRGDTCRQLLKASLVQFSDQQFDLVTWSDVRTPERVAEVVEAALESGATIFFTLVGEDTRSTLLHYTEQALVPAVDLLGPSFSALHDLFKSERSETPGLYYASERETIDRHSAIDYTLKHDDGQRPSGLAKADVVLVGVSRASKSSTCFYLAYQGVKAANVPLVRGVPIPQHLKEMDSSKVVGLQMNVPRLLTLREARAAHLGTTHTDYYVDRREVGAEIRYANELIREHGWKTVNASYMAIEEIAREVMRQCGLGPLR